MVWHHHRDRHSTTAARSKQFGFGRVDGRRNAVSFVRPPNGNRHPSRERRAANDGDDEVLVVALDGKLARADRLMPRMRPPFPRPPNDPTVHPQDASTCMRTGGAPLAATNGEVTAGATCKRRDAVRLALNEPARPAGA
jgi:hypothetical protein